MKAWLLAAMLTGCYVAPTRVVDSTRVSVLHSTRVEGPLADTALAIDVVHGSVTVSAKRQRSCHVNESQAVDVTSHGDVEIRAVDAGWLTPAVVLVFVPVEILALPLDLDLALHALNSTKTERTFRVAQSPTFACPLSVQGVHVDVTLPTAEVVHGVTDAHGRFEVGRLTQPGIIRASAADARGTSVEVTLEELAN